MCTCLTPLSRSNCEQMSVVDPDVEISSIKIIVLSLIRLLFRSALGHYCVTIKQCDHYLEALFRSIIVEQNQAI